MAKEQTKKETAQEFKRRKVLGSNDYRKKVKNGIESLRTYMLNVHGGKSPTNEQIESVKYFCYPMEVEDSRSSRSRDDNTSMEFEEVSATPQKL